MLYYDTITPKTHKFLKALHRIELLSDFVLVGGTALALQIGHRMSIDLDLFSSSNVDITNIPDQIAHLRISSLYQLLNNQSLKLATKLSAEGILPPPQDEPEKPLIMDLCTTFNRRILIHKMN